jgi:hypothetical protein
MNRGKFDGGNGNGMRNVRSYCQFQ